MKTEIVVAEPARKMCGMIEIPCISSQSTYSTAANMKIESEKRGVAAPRVCRGGVTQTSHQEGLLFGSRDRDMRWESVGQWILTSRAVAMAFGDMHVSLLELKRRRWDSVLVGGHRYAVFGGRMMRLRIDVDM